MTHPAAVLHQYLPGIIEPDGSLVKWIPHYPHPPQAAFLALPHREAFFGGAAGPGKSDTLLMGALQYVHVPRYSGLLLRRTYADLTRSGALMDRLREWLSPYAGSKHHGTPIRWMNDEKKFLWKDTGATVEFGHLDGQPEKTRNLYQSAEFQYIAYDEVTEFEEGHYLEPGLTRCRRPSCHPGCRGGVCVRPNVPSDPLSRVPLRTRSASNPGGVGHEFVLARFILSDGKRPFVPARLKDNPSVDFDSYAESLSHLHPTRRAQMLDGDWSAREPGDYWRSEWIEWVEDPIPQTVANKIRMWDLAASERPGACHTAGVLVSRDTENFYTTEDALRFKLTPGPRNEKIISVAKLDGRQVVVGIEEEPGSGGIAQCDDLERMLKPLGFRVWRFKPNVSTGDKLNRADPVAATAASGRWRIAVGDMDSPDAWVRGYMSRMEGFPSNAKDNNGKMVDADEMDATAEAYAYLKDHPPGYTWGRPDDKKRKAPRDSHAAFDEDEADDAEPKRGLDAAFSGWAAEDDDDGWDDVT